ncbi:MAG TPA: (2Fe-2S) ferredoxin domain-containing protein [Candidatus Thermoplasmatota archaeon]|nr:(2Fe-2S) ferredoxin domain-containing protein [Candidatus Thermoplasmatota archaeon]
MVGEPYERQVFVCVYGPWCRIEGSESVRAALKDGVKAAGLASRVRVTKSGCLGQCGHGPMVVAWPENVWYAGVRLEDAPEIVAAHVVGGKPVERLRYRASGPGGNKTDEVKRKEAEKGSAVE